MLVQRPHCGEDTANSSITWQAWRARFGLKESEHIPDLEETITRQSKKGSSYDVSDSVTNCSLVDDCPNGYPRLAAFLSSQSNFGCYRGFSYLHSRVLLTLQDEIVALERELDRKDELDAQNGFHPRLASRARDERESRRDGDQRTRAQIIDDSRLKLVQYG